MRRTWFALPDPPEMTGDYRTYHMRSFVRPSLPFVFRIITVTTLILQLVAAMTWWDAFEADDLVAIIATILLILGGELFQRHGHALSNRLARLYALILLTQYSLVLTLFADTTQDDALFALAAAAIVGIGISAFMSRLRTMIVMYVCLLTLPTASYVRLSGLDRNQLHTVMFLIGVLLVSYFINVSFQRALQATFLDAMASSYVARHDMLTGVSTRPAWIQEAEQAFSTSSTFSVLFVDADHFKSINDQFGHAAGDEVLRRLGTIMRSALPDLAHIGRLGGEEFAVALPDTTNQEAVRVAENLRLRVLRSGHPVPPVSVSIGVATALQDESLARVLERADLSMLRAKNEGRNRVSVDPGNSANQNSVGSTALPPPHHESFAFPSQS